MANHYETSPPMFRNAPLKFIVYLLLIPVFGLGLFLLLWWYIDNKNKRLSIEGNFMKWQEGIFNKTFIDLNTEDIRTVKINQSFFQRMLGTGDLDIYTAGDTPEAVLMGLREPHEIKTMILPQ
jgi:uncharacterized membrane protein YdbT with pleckstrin-like domain